MPTDEFYFGVTFQGNKRISPQKAVMASCIYRASGPGVSSRTVRWGGDLLPQAIGRGDGMARFVSEEKLPARWEPTTLLGSAPSNPGALPSGWHRRFFRGFVRICAVIGAGGRSPARSPPALLCGRCCLFFFVFICKRLLFCIKSCLQAKALCKRKGGVSHAQWRLEALWAALFASLLVLVPLVGGTVLLSRQQLRTQLRQAARSARVCPSSCPRPPTSSLCCCASPANKPGFVLAYLNASQNLRASAQRACRTHRAFAEEKHPLPAACRRWPGPLPKPDRCWPCRRTPVSGFFACGAERIASRYGPVPGGALPAH